MGVGVCLWTVKAPVLVSLELCWFSLIRKSAAEGQGSRSCGSYMSRRERKRCYGGRKGVSRLLQGLFVEEEEGGPNGG